MCVHLTLDFPDNFGNATVQEFRMFRSHYHSQTLAIISLAIKHPPWTFTTQQLLSVKNNDNKKYK